MQRIFGDLFTSATLSGAIDIITVRHDDGTYLSTPFHVRFGRLRLANPEGRKVHIRVNDHEAPFSMRLGMAGEAFFQRESGENADAEQWNGPDDSSDSDAGEAARGDLRDAASVEDIRVPPISEPKAVASAEEYSLRSETDVDTDPGTGVSSPGRPAREAFSLEEGRRDGESEESWWWRWSWGALPSRRRKSVARRAGAGGQSSTPAPRRSQRSDRPAFHSAPRPGRRRSASFGDVSEDTGGHYADIPTPRRLAAASGSLTTTAASLRMRGAGLGVRRGASDDTVAAVRSEGEEGEEGQEGDAPSTGRPRAASMPSVSMPSAAVGEKEAAPGPAAFTRADPPPPPTLHVAPSSVGAMLPALLGDEIPQVRVPEALGLVLPRAAGEEEEDHEGRGGKGEGATAAASAPGADGVPAQRSASPIIRVTATPPTSATGTPVLSPAGGSVGSGSGSVSGPIPAAFADEPGGRVLPAAAPTPAPALDLGRAAVAAAPAPAPEPTGPRLGAAPLGPVPTPWYSTAPLPREATVREAKVTVSRRGKFEMSVPLLKGQFFAWSFSTDSFDIAFLINFRAQPRRDDRSRAPGEWEAEVRPWQRVDSHVRAQEGGFVAPAHGCLDLCWDNGFSRMRAKVLRYRVMAAFGAYPEQVRVLADTPLGVGRVLGCRRGDHMMSVRLSFGHAVMRPTAVTLLEQAVSYTRRPAAGAHADSWVSSLRARVAAQARDVALWHSVPPDLLSVLAEERAAEEEEVKEEEEDKGASAEDGSGKGKQLEGQEKAKQAKEGEEPAKGEGAEQGPPEAEAERGKDKAEAAKAADSGAETSPALEGKAGGGGEAGQGESHPGEKGGEPEAPRDLAVALRGLGLLAGPFVAGAGGEGSWLLFTGDPLEEEGAATTLPTPAAGGAEKATAAKGGDDSGAVQAEGKEKEEEEEEGGHEAAKAETQEGEEEESTPAMTAAAAAATATTSAPVSSEAGAAHAQHPLRRPPRLRVGSEARSPRRLALEGEGGEDGSLTPTPNTRVRQETVRTALGMLHEGTAAARAATAQVTTSADTAPTPALTSALHGMAADAALERRRMSFRGAGEEDWMGGAAGQGASPEGEEEEEEEEGEEGEWVGELAEGHDTADQEGAVQVGTLADLARACGVAVGRDPSSPVVLLSRCAYGEWGRLAPRQRVALFRDNCVTQAQLRSQPHLIHHPQLRVVVGRAGERATLPEASLLTWQVAAPALAMAASFDQVLPPTEAWAAGRGACATKAAADVAALASLQSCTDEQTMTAGAAAAGAVTAAVDASAAAAAASEGEGGGGGQLVRRPLSPTLDAACCEHVSLDTLGVAAGLMALTESRSAADGSEGGRPGLASGASEALAWSSAHAGADGREGRHGPGDYPSGRASAPASASSGPAAGPASAQQASSSSSFGWVRWIFRRGPSADGQSPRDSAVVPARGGEGDIEAGGGGDAAAAESGEGVEMPAGMEGEAPAMHPRDAAAAGTRRRRRRRSRGRRLRRRTICPTSEQLAQLPLRAGANAVTFEVKGDDGTSACVAATLFLWSPRSKIVISDVDGTITKSDVLGHIMYMAGIDWTHRGVASLFGRVRANGYHIVYLTSRAIGQHAITKDYLTKIEQDGLQLPPGPVITSPDRLFAALHREVVLRQPDRFKIASLSTIKDVFRGHHCFWAGFGNRPTDVVSYEAVGVPRGKIFIINPSGTVTHSNPRYRHSYDSMTEMADSMFPCIDDGSAELDEELGHKPPHHAAMPWAQREHSGQPRAPATSPAPAGEAAVPAQMSRSERSAPALASATEGGSEALETPARPADRAGHGRSALEALALASRGSESSPRRLWRQGERSATRLGWGSVAEEEFNAHNFWKVDRRSLVRDSSDEEG